jgi:hypothetical protein
VTHNVAGVKTLMPAYSTAVGWHLADWAWSPEQKAVVFIGQRGFFYALRWDVRLRLERVPPSFDVPPLRVRKDPHSTEASYRFPWPDETGLMPWQLSWTELLRHVLLRDVWWDRPSPHMRWCTSRRWALVGEAPRGPHLAPVLQCPQCRVMVTVQGDEDRLALARAVAESPWIDDHWAAGQIADIIEGPLRTPVVRRKT